MTITWTARRVALTVSGLAALMALPACGLAERAASEVAGAASCVALDLAGKGLDGTGNLSSNSVENLAGAAHAVASAVKELPLDIIPADASARIDDAANQLDLAATAFATDPEGATEVVERAVGQINDVVADVKGRLDC